VAAEKVFHDGSRSRVVPVRMYATGANGRRPVVIVSHGIGEDRESYEYLGRALAAAGFLAVHITHAGTDRAMLERGYRHLYRAVKEPRNWLDRSLDVTFVLDQLEHDPRADTARAAVVGHSAGAFTAFSVAGLTTARGQMRDPRVKAIVPMSMPRMDGVVPDGGYDSVAVPVLNVTGTCDTSLLYRTFPRHRRAPFEQSRASGQYLVTVRGLNHDHFSARSSRYHAVIASLAVAFLRGVLLEDSASARWFSESGRQKLNGIELTLEQK
jgi:predicted dienelactone hydrolase